MSESPPDVRLTVIGGAGFLGSHLVDRLLTEHPVVDVIDDLSTGSLANLAQARDVARSGGLSLTIDNLDAASPEAAALLMRRPPTVLYMLAGLPSASTPPDVAAHSLQTMVAVFEAARRAGVPKVVTALPASVLYGMPAARDLPVKEGAIAPRGVRGAVARAVVDILEWYRDTSAMEFTVAAVATVYGPRQRIGLVPSFIAAARQHTAPAITGDGRQTRDLVYVDDVVDALARAAWRGGGLVVNVGTGVQTSLLDLWSAVAGSSGVAPEFVPEPADALRRFAISPVRARIHLEWSPWTTVAEGIEQVRAATPT